MSSEFVDMAVEYLWHTDGAVLVSDGARIEAWFPLEYVRFNDQDGTTPGVFDGLSRNQSINLEAQEWIAINKGLI